MTTPTTTAQATVLTEEQLDNAFALLWNLSEPSANSTIAEIVSHIDSLTEQVRVLRAELRQTLATCANCGTGYPPKWMVSVGDDWLCTQCAKALIIDLREERDYLSRRLRETGGLHAALEKEKP